MSRIINAVFPKGLAEDRRKRFAQKATLPTQPDKFRSATALRVHNLHDTGRGLECESIGIQARDTCRDTSQTHRETQVTLHSMGLRRVKRT